MLQSLSEEYGYAEIVYYNEKGHQQQVAHYTWGDDDYKRSSILLFLVQFFLFYGFQYFLLNQS